MWYCAVAASKKLGVPYYLDAPTMLKELKPDLYLAPDLGSMSQYRFEGMPEAIEAGYRLGKDNISVIRELCEISG